MTEGGDLILSQHRNGIVAGFFTFAGWKGNNEPDVWMLKRFDPPAARAFIARIGGIPFAVQRPGQLQCQGILSNSLFSEEKVGVSHLPTGQRPLEKLLNALLTYDLLPAHQNACPIPK